ncbi:multiple ankyrin repeats single kh domain-containing protein [Apiospora kogelbergensis]|uniref:Multiple ankyrin repeats single kh domain-containing protein n=1 Tax=Apiospora kogelbergensis TaxID=1337665 RepID=A0AAW0QY93_9PEZI
MTSTNRSARIPDEKWEAHKANIVRQFVDHDQSLEAIVDSLRKSSDFIVTRNQLHNRLNKTWRIHKKTSKGEAEALWRCIDYRIAERRTHGKASNVIINGAIIESAKVTKETGRYSRRAWSSGIVHSSIWSSSVDKELISKQMDRSLHHSIYHLLSSGYDTTLLIPETKENEAAQRMGIMQFDSAEDPLREQLKLLFFHLTNQSLYRSEYYRLSQLPSMLQIIKLIDFVGFMQKPLDPGEDLTLLAAREKLFQLVFNFIGFVFAVGGPQAPPFRRLLDDNINVITRFIEWLLQSGQDPNVKVFCYSGHRTSALQSALQYRLDALVGILIQHNTDVRGRFPYIRSACEPYCQAHLPPLVLAMMSGGNPNSETLLSNIEQNRTLLEEFLSIKLFQGLQRGQEPNEPDIDHRLYHLLEGSEDEVMILSVLETIRKTVGPTWLETSNHAVGLLFYASRAGYIDVLGFLLDNNVDINITNTPGSTALHNAVIGRRSPYATCRYLLEHGAVLDSSDAYMSAFHLACYKVDDVEILRLLCSHGARVHRTMADILSARKWLDYHNTLSIEELLVKLGNNSTPLKAVINNMRLDPQESVKFCMQMGQSSTEVAEWMLDAALHSSNIQLLPVALHTGSWHVLGLDRRDGLLRITMQCCNHFFGPPDKFEKCCKGVDIGKRITVAHELLDAGVNIGPSDAIRAVRLGDWGLVQRIRVLDPLSIAESPLPYRSGAISFLEATILWCPHHAFEAMKTTSYDPGALCAAALKGCKGELSLDLVEELLASRLPYNSSALDATMEMTAIGISLYHGQTRLLEVLRKNLPTHSFARLPGCKIDDWEVINDTVNPWWYDPRRHGSVACFAFNADTESFTTIVKQYCWDIACLSMVIENCDHTKAEVLMNHKALRQITPPWSIIDEYPFSPLQLAIRTGDTKLIQVCVKLGESIHGGWGSEPNDWEGHTALTDAVSYGNLEIIDLVLKLGADIDQKGLDIGQRLESLDSTLYTPLQIACIGDNLAIPKRLIAQGADLNAVSDQDFTALEYAAVCGRLDTVHLLLSAGADVKGKYGHLLDLAIIQASANGHEVIVKLLKAHAEKVGYVLEDDKDYEDDEDDEDDEGEDTEGDFYQLYQAFCETSNRGGGFV